MVASLHPVAPVPDSGDYIDLTSLTKSDWVRMGARVYGDELIKLGIDEIDEMFCWLRTGRDPSEDPSRQSPTFSTYNAVIEVSPHDVNST